MNKINDFASYATEWHTFATVFKHFQSMIKLLLIISQGNQRGNCQKGSKLKKRFSYSTKQ